MPELPRISEDFTADASEYVAAVQEMIDRTQELLDKVTEVKALISQLDGKSIEVNVTGDAVEVINAIKEDLDSLESRTVEIKIVYKNIGGPENVAGGTVTDTVNIAGGGDASKLANDIRNLEDQVSRLVRVEAEATAETNLLNDFTEMSAKVMKDASISDAQRAITLNHLADAAREVRMQQKESAAAETEAAAAAAAEAAAMNELADKQVTLNNLRNMSIETTMQNVSAERLQAQTNMLLAQTEDVLKLRYVGTSDSVKYLSDVLDSGGASSAIFLAAMAKGVNEASAFSIAAHAAGNSVGKMLIPLSAASFGITGIGTAVHLVVMGIFEFLAVFVPAMYAAAAAVAVLGQGIAEVIAPHIKALYTATEALGGMSRSTAGDILGLGHSLQQAQNMANPMAYTLLGEALIGIKAASDIGKNGLSSFGSLGLTVGQMLERFGARIDLDIIQNMSKIRQVVASAAADLQGFGQIFGNIGHAILNLAAAMPGLAEIILQVISGITSLIKWVSSLNPVLIAVVMGIEEAYRWSGLLVGAFGLLGRAIALVGTLGIPVFAAIGSRFSEALSHIVLGISGFVSNVGGGIARVVSLFSTDLADGIGMATSGVVGKLGAMAEFMKGPWGIAIGLGAAAVVILAIALTHVKSATEQFISSTQKAVAAATNLQVLNVIGQQLEATNNKLSIAQTQASKALNDTAIAGSVAGTHLGMYGGAAAAAAVPVNELTQNQQKLFQQSMNVITGASAISREYGVSFTGALAIADAAGVKLINGFVGQSNAAKMAQIQVQALVLGYQRMDQSGQTLTNSMNAVYIQAELQRTKVQQLNSAWDQFISMSTSLTGSFTQLQLDMSQMGNVAQTLGGRIRAFSTSAANGVQLTVSQIATSLKSFSGSSAQVWQSFNQSISQANTFMDALRVAAAAGTVGNQTYGRAAAYVVAQLEPFASKSAAALAEVMALAQEAGGPAYDKTKSLAQNYETLVAWTDNNRISTKQFTGDLAGLTEGISNVTQVAKNFAGTMQTDVLSAIAAGAVNTKGITGLTQQYTKSLQENGAQSSTTKNIQNQLTAELKHYGFTASDIKQIEQELTNSYHQNTNTIGNGASVRQGLIYDLIRIGGHAQTAKMDIRQLQTAIAQLSGKTVTVSVLGRGGEVITSSVGPKGTVTVYPVRAMAEGGVVPGYEPGIDSVHAVLSKGEGILIPQAVKALGGERGIRALNKAAQHFAWGGVVGLPQNISDTTGAVTSEANAKVLAETLTKFNAMVRNKLNTIGISVPGHPPGSFLQWLAAGMAAAGVSGANWQFGLEEIALHESGFNPNAINLTDSNAAAGDPSRGLMQLIMTTFQAYHARGTSWNIYDPVANIAAAIRYIEARYGSINNVPGVASLAHGGGYVGYDQGGMLMPGLTLAYNGTGVPEKITAPYGDTVDRGPVIIPIHIDGKKVFEAVAPYAYRKSSRNNGNANAGNYWTPGS